MSPRRTAVPVGPDEERQSVSYQVERGDEIVAARDPDMRDATADVGVQADRVAEDRAIGAGRALRVELGHGPALALVAFEQRLARPSPQDPAQLPADVEAVADRGVEPGGAARGDPVRGVADQERVAHPESLREPDAVAEHTRTLDLDRQVRSAGGVADPALHLLGGEGVDVVDRTVPAPAERPAVRLADWQEDAVLGLGDDEVDGVASLTDEVPERRAEVDRQALLERLRALLAIPSSSRTLLRMPSAPIT